MFNTYWELKVKNSCYSVGWKWIKVACVSSRESRVLIVEISEMLLEVPSQLMRFHLRCHFKIRIVEQHENNGIITIELPC